MIINNNYKTSKAPISSKRIELSGAPSTGLNKLIVRVRCKVNQQMIGWQRTLGRIRESEKVSF